MVFLTVATDIVYTTVGIVLFIVLFGICSCLLLFSLSSLYSLFQLIFLGKRPKIDGERELLCVHYKNATDVIMVITIVFMGAVLGFGGSYALLLYLYERFFI